MKKIIIFLCILIIAASCELNSTNKTTGDNQNPSVISSQLPKNTNDTLTIFLTGQIFGSLKPCGCSGGQLGGLNRRPAFFNTVPDDKRLIIDTGSIVENDSMQSRIKFDIIMQAFSYLDYDIVNLTQQDLELALGSLGNSSIGFISSYQSFEELPAGNQHEFILDAEHVNISVAAFDPQEIPIETISEFFPSEPGHKKVNILILNNYTEEIIQEIARMQVVDCLICPVDSDEPTTIETPGQKMLACSVGRFGRYISKIEIQNTSENDLSLDFSFQPVKEEIEQDEWLKALYKEYQLIVKETGLLEQNPRFILPDGLKYLGSQSCETGDCHSEPYIHQLEYVTWYDNEKTDVLQHSHAYETLVEVGSQYDPECVICHVVGYEYKSGFKSAEKTPHLEDVGCEVCHGPGSAHYENPYENTTTPIPDKIDLCLNCHKPEHDGSFAGHEEEKLEIINHWPEPNDVSNVK